MYEIKFVFSFYFVLCQFSYTPAIELRKRKTFSIPTKVILLPYYFVFPFLFGNTIDTVPETVFVLYPLVQILEYDYGVFVIRNK